MRHAAHLLLLLVATPVISQYQQRYPQQQQPQQQAYQQNARGQYNNNQRIQQPTNQNGYPNGRVNNQYNQNGMNSQNGQYPQGMRNNGDPSSRTVVVNSPVKLQGVGPVTSTSSTAGAQVDIRLSSYSNADLSLSNITTCSCPAGQFCNFLSPNQQNSCSFSFTTIISAKDQSVQYVQSDFYPFAGQISAGNWTNAHSFQMPSKPVSIDVFVQHLGTVIDKASASLLFFNHLTLVDTFVVDLTQYSPGTNQNSQTYTLMGKLLNTQLQMTLNIQCINARKGAMCDLNCPNMTTNSNNVICTDSENRNQSCRVNSYTGTVDQCTICNEIGTNGTCATLITTEQVGVSYAFRTWTIVLGCLLGIAVLFILCLIISYIIIKNRESEEDEAAAYKNPQFSNGKASRPLLEDEWNTAPRRPTELDRNTEDSYSPRTGAGTMSRQEHQV